MSDLEQKIWNLLFLTEMKFGRNGMTSHLLLDRFWDDCRSGGNLGVEEFEFDKHYCLSEIQEALYSMAERNLLEWRGVGIGRIWRIK